MLGALYVYTGRARSPSTMRPLLDIVFVEYFQFVVVIISSELSLTIWLIISVIYMNDMIANIYIGIISGYHDG